ncbi:MAG: precorrin-8X methylmutase, partial [Rhodospirillales bacterium]
MEYLRNPAEIYKASFAAIRAETDLSSVPPDLHDVALRLVHSCADTEIVPNLRWHGDVVNAARSALNNGAPILVDSRMTETGIIRSRLPKDNPVICTLNEPGVAERAIEIENTRSAAAIDLWLPNLNEAVVAIGNAPTALFHLLELLENPSTPTPAAIFAFPVGFIGAAESKDALIASKLYAPYVT